MSNKACNSIYRRLAITTAASALLGLGAIASVQAESVKTTSETVQSGIDAPLILAEGTVGMERRQDRRDDRQDDRGDRRDTRQDCRDEEGVGKDKRDCKQEGRQERGKDDKG